MKDDILDMRDSDNLGFSFLDSDVIDESDNIRRKLEEILLEVNKFLDKLAENPEKEIIKWPDRAKVVKNFQEKINAII